MAVTQNCLAENNVSTYFNSWKAVFTCGKRSSQVARLGRPNRWNKCASSSLQCSGSRKDGEWNIDIYRCRDVLFSLVPKKLGTSRQRFQQKLGSLTSLARHPRLAASCSSFHFQLPTIHQPGRDALELRLGGWTKTDMSRKKTDLKVQRRHLQRNCWTKLSRAENTKCCNETVRRLTSLLLAPLLQRGPGVLAESLTSHWDAWSCKRLSSTYVSLGLIRSRPSHILTFFNPLQNMRLEWETWLETMTVAQTHHVGCKHLETAHSLDSTAACFKQDQSNITINHVSSVLPRLNFCASHWF